MTILKDYRQFDGVGWSTGYITNALAYQGVTAPHTGKPYSEAMIMGVSGGICIGYFSFEYEGHLPHIHVLTRYPFNDDLPPAVFDRLAIPIQSQQTTNPEKGAANVINALATGKPAIVWVDAASLPYNLIPIEDIWLIMPLVVYGYDQTNGTVNIADRACVGLTATTEQFAAARTRIGKIKHRLITLGAPNPDKLPAAVEAGIRSMLAVFTFVGDKPNFVEKAKGNFGFNGLEKWAKLLEDKKGKESWAVKFAPGARMVEGLISGFKSLEVWYTGGQGARGMYADFLDEAADVLHKPALREAAGLFRQSAARWGELSTSLLPDRIAPFKEMRELLLRDYALFREQGNASLDERREIQAHLAALKAHLAAEFPLSEAETAVLRGEIRAAVLKVLDAERAAVSALENAIL